MTVLAIVLIIFLIAADQLTKLYAINVVKPQGVITVIDNFYYFVYVENRGAAFGIMQNKQWLFIVITLILFAAFAWTLYNYKIEGKLFFAAFVLAGLNHHFGWTLLPSWIVWAGVVIFLLAYCLFGEVLRENRYLSRTIEVREDQEVVSTGLYGVIRHPMYTATVLLFLAMPLVLGSWPSFIIMLAYIPIIVKRIKNEEQVLEEELKGYKDYKEKVRYRLIPYIW